MSRSSVNHAAQLLSRILQADSPTEPVCVFPPAKPGLPALADACPLPRATWSRRRYSVRVISGVWTASSRRKKSLSWSSRWPRKSKKLLTTDRRELMVPRA